MSSAQNPFWPNNCSAAIVPKIWWLKHAHVVRHVLDVQDFAVDDSRLERTFIQALKVESFFLLTEDKIEEENC